MNQKLPRFHPFPNRPKESQANSEKLYTETQLLAFGKLVGDIVLSLYEEGEALCSKTVDLAMQEAIVWLATDKEKERN